VPADSSARRSQIALNCAHSHASVFIGISPRNAQTASSGYWRPSTQKKVDRRKRN